MPRLHAYRDDALAEHDVLDLVDALKTRKVSAEELVEAAIARTSAVAEDLGALAYTAYDRARVEARDPRSGRFSGIPTVVKDNADVAGMPTRFGSDAFAARPARVDGGFAKVFLATGPVVLGKSQLSEFGFNAVAEHSRFGPVRNPWSPEHTAGASSSGSAALVAAGALPFAHANDGGGSIRIPASVNGLVGLKATRGRFPQESLNRRMPVHLVVDGVLTRSVRDTAAFVAEAEKHYRNPRLAPVGEVYRPGKRRLRVAMVTSTPAGQVDAAVVEQTEETARKLEALGHRVEPIEAPFGEEFVDDFLLYWGLLAGAVVRTGRLTYRGSWAPQRLDNLTHGLERHLRANLRRMPAAIRRIGNSWRTSAVIHETYDVVLSPTLAAETPVVGHLDPAQDFDLVRHRLLDWVGFTPMANATGDPAISLPLAQTYSGLPLGMMFSAGRGGEGTLLRLALELEEAHPWPNLAQAR